MPEMAQILSGIIVSIVAASGAFLAARASARASIKNSATSSRVEMEKEAYERARKMDTETIERQDKEIDELREDTKNLSTGLRALASENQKIIEENDRLRRENRKLNEKVNAALGRLTRLERRTTPPSTDELLRVRHEDLEPPIV